MYKQLGISLALSCLFVIGACLSPVPPSSNEGLQLEANSDDLDYRLPGNLRPFKYEIRITPNLNQWTFVGHVIISIHTQVTGVKQIILLSNDLGIVDISVTKQGEPNVNLYEKHDQDAVTHKLTITTKSSLEDSTIYYVEINYNGNMKDDMSGFHQSVYMENGVEKRLGTTQFQTTSSRRAIPCFDEPGYKAVFELSIVRPRNYHTLSNTKIKESIALNNDLFLDVYEPTPFMSVYLLAFIVSELTPRGNDIFKVWARPDMLKETEYAHTVGVKLLDHYNSYTDYSYYTQMKKLDMAAVPDNRAGGMENYGMIIFRESYLLYRSDKTSAYAKQEIATVIAHEQAHLWFGDLVSSGYEIPR